MILNCNLFPIPEDTSVKNRLLSYVSDQRRIDDLGVRAWDLIKELNDRELKIEKKKMDNLTNFSGFKIPRYQRDYNWEKDQLMIFGITSKEF